MSILQDHGITKLNPKIGTIIQAATNPGPGWLECDGTALNRADYPELAALRPHAAFVATTIPSPGGGMIAVCWAGGTTFVGLPYGSPFTTRTLYRTTDNGATWSTLTDVLSDTISQISRFARNPTTGVLMLTDGNTSMIFTSIDNGLTWQRKTDVLFGAAGSVIAPDGASNAFYIVKRVNYENPRSGVYKTVDNGTTWTEILLTIDLYEPAGFVYLGYTNSNMVLSTTHPYGVDVSASNSSYRIAADQAWNPIRDPVTKIDYLYSQLGKRLTRWEWDMWEFNALFDLKDINITGMSIYNNAFVGTTGDTTVWATPLAGGVFSYDGKMFEYGKNLLPSNTLMRGFQNTACNSEVMMFVGYQCPILAVTRDATKFNVHGVMEKSNVNSYVYSGRVL